MPNIIINILFSRLFIFCLFFFILEIPDKSSQSFDLLIMLQKTMAAFRLIVRAQYPSKKTGTLL